MSLSPLSRRRSAYTDQYSFVNGDYAIGEEKVPYFSISMTIREADQFLRLARELPFNDSEPVNLEELFQRAVDEERATGPIATYLLQPGSLKFFNSFTVVLLPVDPERSGAIVESYVDDPDAPAEEPNSGLLRRSIGPVQIDELPDSDMGFIRWSTKRARAVILDGQHRFLALKKILDSPQQSLLNPDTTKIPVLLLVLDPRAGFIPARDQGRVLQACRSIFVALNKHAIAVSKTRTYLLDDQDLVSVSMRRLMTSQLGSANGDTGEQHDRLPLALVDWHSDQAKFDRGFYLTSILGLHETIRQIYPSRCDESDYDGLVQFISEVSALISPGADSRWSELALRARVKKAEDEALPFIFSAEEVSAAADAFARGVGQAIVRPLRELRPYRELRERYETEGLIGGSLELWLGFDKSGKQAFQARTGNDPSGLARTISDEVKAGDNSFAVVFQRGMLLSAVRFDTARSDFAAEWSVGDGRFSILDSWVERVNIRIIPFLKDVDFWLGIGMKNDRNVNYTKVGTGGIKGFTSLAVLCPIDELQREAFQFVDGVTPSIPEGGEALAWKMISDPTSPYLRDDTVMAGATSHARQLVAYRWLATQFRYITRGRSTSVVTGATREACMEFRNAARAYVRNEARAAGTAPDDDVILQAVLVLGARRLAVIIENCAAN
ncbi:DNA sulfur modification protein DndB [Streptomyces sp. NPDC005989]|uniref:DNA sulfur modification protein DndB n=1 Tax=Streptomyces sp. NPDC005989 TaxID=3156727 RepID=UPI0033F0B0D0